MAFVPSTSFYRDSAPDPPPASHTPRRPKRLYVPPTNTLPPPPAATPPAPNSAPQSPTSPHTPPPTAPPEPVPLEVPVSQEELASNPLLQKTVTGNFAAFKQKPQGNNKPNPPKSHGNFVKLNMKKNSNLAKMGKVRNASFAHRKVKYMYRHQDIELPVRCFSKGFGEEKRRTASSLDDILHEEFGFSEWKAWQKEAIEGILAGDNALIVLPTGSGKSLVYQMCSRVLGGLTVAVFPLVSLIVDQLTHIPACLAAGSLHSSQTSTETALVLKALRANSLDILLLTPEKLSYFLALPLRDVKLICVDEAHCVSEWSHAFRSAYYDIVTFSRKHQAARWLALTATATPRTITDIQGKLNITRTIVSAHRLRPNIKVTVSRESDILSAASDLIRSLPKSDSVLVFAAYQQQAQSLCDWLRAQGFASKCYHGKLTEAEKAGVQTAFNSGLARILVTTMAFGMGIDKANIRTVVHLALPKSIEQFIQESGRAGRDGEACWSHVFLGKEQYYAFQRYIVTEHVTERCVMRLVRSFHPPAEGDKRVAEGSGGTHAMALVCLETHEVEDSLGLNRETIRMVLALLENSGLLTYLSASYLQATLSFHRRPVAEVAAQYSAVSQALATGRECAGKWSCRLPLVASKLEVEPCELVQVLRRLEATGDIRVEFKKDCMCFRLHRGVDDDELPVLAAKIASQCQTIKMSELHKLQSVYQMLHLPSSPAFSQSANAYDSVSAYIAEYYEEGNLQVWPGLPLPADMFAILSDIMGDFTYSPDEKDMACVLMGLRSEKTRRDLWDAHKYWGVCAECDFFTVVSQARLFLRNQLVPSEKRRKTED